MEELKKKDKTHSEEVPQNILDKLEELMSESHE
jgi:hypothetical protein